MKMARKLAPQTICPDLLKLYGKSGAKVLVDDSPVVQLFNVFGKASRLKPYKSTYGDDFALVGTFEAVRLDTGEIFRAPVAFLPKHFHDMIVTELSGETRPEFVEFAIKVGLEYSVKGNTGYAFVCEPLLEPKADIGLDHLRKLAGVPTSAALPAPTPEPAPKAVEQAKPAPGAAPKDKGGKK